MSYIEIPHTTVNSKEGKELNATMRLPYVPEKPTSSNAADQAFINRLFKSRGKEGLTPLDRAMLHSPPFTRGFMQLFSAIRGKSTLPPDIMELAMCRVGALNGAAYEWMHHAPLLIKAQVGADGVETVRSVPLHAEPSGAKESDGTVQGLSEDHWAVLRYVDAMTKDVKVPEEVFEGVTRILNERQVVELSK